MIKWKLKTVLKFFYTSEANRDRCHQQILYVSCLYIPQEFCTPIMHQAALCEKTVFLIGEVRSRAIVVKSVVASWVTWLVMDPLCCFAVLNKNSYKTLLLSVLHYNLMFLWEEHIVFALASSLRKSRLKSIHQLMYCWFPTTYCHYPIAVNNNTYSMVQSPSWEANWFAVSQEIPRISWNPKVHYRTHKRPPPIPILGQPNPVHIPTSHLLEILPNIIHPSTPRSPQWSLSLRFPHQDPIRPPLLPHTWHMPSPSHSSRFYHPHNIGWGVQII